MRSACLLVLTAGLAAAAPPATFEVPKDPKPVAGYFRFTPKTDAKGVTYVGLDGIDPFPNEELVDKRRFLLPVAGMKPGKAYRFRAVASLLDEHASFEFSVALDGPPPPAPRPDEPPAPRPDEPPPPDEAAPIPAPGLRVLIVFETSDQGRLTAGQRAAVFGQPVRDYLDARCAVGPDGRSREYRIYDQNQSVAGESKLWQDAMARPRKSVPWLVVSNGKAGYEGPLPATTAEFFDLVKKYEGK